VNVETQPLKKPLLLLGLCAVMLVVLYGSTAEQIYDHDCFGYAVAARGLLEHKVLYKTTWQDKPPFAILFFVIPQLFARGSYSALQIALGVWMALQALIVFVMLRKYNPLAALLTGVLLALLPLTRLEFIWPSTEHLSNTFILINCIFGYIFIRESGFTLSQCFLAGSATCAGFHCRQTALLSAAIPGIAILLAPCTAMQKLKGIACAALGSAAVFLFVFALIAWLGDWNGYLYTVFTYPKLYAAGFSIEAVLAMAGGYFSIPVALLTLALLPAALASRYRTLVIVAALVSIAMAVAPFRVAFHYLASMLPLAGLLFFLWLDADEKGDAAMPRFKLNLAGGVAAFALLAGLQNIVWASTHPNTALLSDVAGKIDTLAEKSDTLFVVGDHADCIYYFSKVPPANTYFMDFQLDPHWSEILPEKIETVLARYRSEPPGIITIHTNLLGLKLKLNSLNLVNELLNSGAYRPAGEKNGWSFFKRLNAAAPAH
jgi:hypothetical protein